MHWQNLFSFRVLIAAVLLGVLASIPFSLIWEPLGVAAFIIVATAVWLGAALNPANVLYCPHCRKRVKAGADTCHHCGQSVLPT